MDIKLEKYTEELLKGYCEKDPVTSRKFNTKINVIKKYSTNVLEDHSPDSLKECKIRDSDPLINMTNPISKSREDYENILGNIIETECKLLDNNSTTLTPELLKLINFCNQRILEFSKDPVNSVEHCNFKVKVLDKSNNVLFDQSTIKSISLTLIGLLRDMIPIRICKNINDLQKIYDEVINVISERDPSYVECKLSEYMFHQSDGNRTCLTNNRDKIINTVKFILDLYDEFCVADPGKPYISELKMFIDRNLYNNKFNVMYPLDSNNFHYLNNPGDGDCLFLAVIKNLCMLSNIERKYPNNKLLRQIGTVLRFETCKYMFENRFSVINKNGTIENNTEANIWILAPGNSDKFNNLMKSLKLKRNKTLFKNPTNFTLDELLINYGAGTIDNFTKYCILMAQYSMNSEYFLLPSGEKLTLSLYTGICEIACLALYLNKNIICVSTSTADLTGNITYNVGTGFSHIWKYNPDNIPELPLIIYLRGYSTKQGGSRSDHFETIWHKNLGKPAGINTPVTLKKTQLPLFGFNSRQSEYLIPNIDSSPEIDIKSKVYKIEDYITTNIPNDYTETLPSIISKYWDDISKKLSVDADTVIDPHFPDPSKEIFRGDDSLRFGDYLYTISYITRFTDLLEKEYVLKSELEDLIKNIIRTKIDINKPININISEPDIDGNINPEYKNFISSTKEVLKELIKKDIITKFIPTVLPEKESVVEEDEEKSEVDIDSKEWIIFGNYYYKKIYLELPFSKTTSKKKIITKLKKDHLHRQDNPIRVVENFGAGPSYVFSIYTTDDVDELERDISEGLLKKLSSITHTPKLATKEHTAPQKNLKIKSKKKLKIKISKELKNSCEGKAPSQGGLYKKALRLALINHVKKLYKGDSAKISKEISLLESYKKKSDLEKYCKVLLSAL